MAKKKKSDASDCSDLLITDLIRYIINLPKSKQKELLKVMDLIETMSPAEKSHMLEGLFVDAVSPDEKDFVADDDSDDDVYDVDDADYDDYPPFLPRPNVKKYTLRVTLNGIQPSIYRKFCVPSNISLRHLSELILELMGWENQHLNQFCKGNDYYAPAYQREGEIPPLFGNVNNYNQEDFTISDILSEKGKHVSFEYDFGDSWIHEVKLSSIGEYGEGEDKVSFVKGERACPPEDCGGVWGYRELLDLRAKKQAKKRLTAEERDRLEWYELDDINDPELSPEYFNVEYAEDVCEYYG